MAWAPGKSVKGKEFKDFWEIPCDEIPEDPTIFDLLEEGGCIDEETLQDNLKPPRQQPEDEAPPSNAGNNQVSEPPPTFPSMHLQQQAPPMVPTPIILPTTVTLPMLLHHPMQPQFSLHLPVDCNYIENVPMELPDISMEDDNEEKNKDIEMYWIEKVSLKLPNIIMEDDTEENKEPTDNGNCINEEEDDIEYEKQFTEDLQKMVEENLRKYKDVEVPESASNKYPIVKHLKHNSSQSLYYSPLFNDFFYQKKPSATTTSVDPIENSDVQEEEEALVCQQQITIKTTISDNADYCPPRSVGST